LIRNIGKNPFGNKDISQIQSIKITLDISCMDMLRWSCKLMKRGKL